MKALFIVFCTLAALCGAATGPAASAAEPANLGAANEVCSYVAAAYNHGRQDKLWGYPDPVDIGGDGKLRHVYIFEQGTAHVPVIIASTKVLTDDERDAAAGHSEVDFFDTSDSGIDYDAVPHVFQFKERYYVVYEEDDGPAALVKPDSGVLCRFKRHFAAVVTENHAPAICKKVRTHTAFKKLPSRPLPNVIVVPEAATLDLPGPHSPTIARYSQVKLDPAAASLRVGYFKYASSAGSGCSADGVVVLQGQKIEKSPRNTALLAAQEQVMNCRGSRAFLIQTDGQKLIEIDGGEAAQRTVPPRMLVRLRGNRVATVCRVEHGVTYTSEPEPIKKTP